MFKKKKKDFPTVGGLQGATSPTWSNFFMSTKHASMNFEKQSTENGGATHHRVFFRDILKGGWMFLNDLNSPFLFLLIFLIQICFPFPDFFVVFWTLLRSNIVKCISAGLNIWCCISDQHLSHPQP